MDRFEELYQRLSRGCSTLELRRGENMSDHISFRVGGPVPLMALPRTEGEARTAIRVAGELGITPFFLGNGTNLLVPDQGAERFLIKLSGKYGVDPFNRVEEVNGQLVAGGAVTLAMLSASAMGRNLTGLEFASGIPGTVGGAVMMNAGAYGGEMSQVLTSVKVMDLEGQVRQVPVDQCALGYRTSAFMDGKSLILGASFRLEGGEYGAIKARMDELAAKRKEKQPLEFPSAGSTFKRPEGHFAGALIEQSGLKGLTVGGAQVSEKHAGFVINRGGATCADVLTLVEQVKDVVRRDTGVELELEVRILR